MKILSLLRRTYESGSALILSALIVPGAVFAQSESDKTIVLSPFTVTEGSAVGYQATETLAGTRIRTPLKDVANSIDIVTKELLEDLAATDVMDALVYSANVYEHEADNRGDTDGNNQHTNPEIRRIRGVRSIENSRNFFETDGFGSIDIYNSDQLVLSRGANSVLFGVGDAIGVVMTATKQANVNRSFANLNLRFDSNDSSRYHIDLNRVLVDDKLALRMNYLVDDEHGSRFGEGKYQERLHLAATYQPFKNTKLRAEYENYTADFSRYPLRWFNDRGLMEWMQNDYALTVADYQHLAPAADLSGVPFPSVVATNTTVHPDGLRANQLFSQVNRYTLMTNANGGGPTDLAYVHRPRMAILRKGNTFDGAVQNTAMVPDPLEWYGIHPETQFLANSPKGTPNQQNTGEIFAAFWEQKISENLYFELATQYSLVNYDVRTNRFQNLTVDVNPMLGDGTTNPGFNQFFAEATLNWADRVNERKQHRATLVYEKDLKDVHRWLGKNNIVALATYSSGFATRQDSRLWAYDYGVGGWNMVFQQMYFNNQNTPQSIGDNTAFYYDPSVLDVSNVATFSWQPSQAPSFNVRQSKGAIAAWQAYWFDERLVTTLGVQTDTLKSWTDDATTRARIPDDQFGTNTQWFGPARANGVMEDPTASPSANTNSVAVVYHVNRWLSLAYNDSENFVFNEDGYYSVRDQPLQPTEGRSRDFSVRLAPLDDKLFINVAYYQAQEANRRVNDGSLTNISTIWETAKNWSTHSEFSDQRILTGVPDPYPSEGRTLRDYTNLELDGYELKVVYNPTPNWRIMLTGAHQTSVQGDSLTGLLPFIEENEPQWLGWAGQLASATGNPGSAAAADTIRDSIDAAKISVRDFVELDGVDLSSLGDYSLSFVTKYAFSEGLFKGWSIGGTAKQNSPRVVGYDRIDKTYDNGDVLNVIDVNKPVKGGSTSDFGAFISYRTQLFDRYPTRFQLNVTNLFDDTDPKVQSVAVDTRGVLGNPGDVVPIRWTYSAPRTFILTMDISL